MKDLISAIELIRKYNNVKLEDCVKEFEEYSGQRVPKEAVDEFKLCGLNNVDMFTSDWLNRYGIKNVYQI